MTTGPMRPSHRSESAGTCSRCARDPPPGLQRAGGLSDPRTGGPRSSPRPPRLPLLAAPPLQAVPSVSQAPVPSAGQVLVSVLLLPNCRPCGSGSGARHVKRKRCSWRAPPWVTFTGNQGVQGVLRRTSGQASGLHVLNSCRVRVVSELPGLQTSLHRATRPRDPCPHQAAAWAGVAILAGPTARLHATSTVVAALAPGAPGSPEDGHRARCVFITEPGEVGGVSPYGEVLPSPGWRMPHHCLSAATASSPLLPALAHADAAPVAGRRVAATSLTDLEADPTGRAALCPR